MLTFRTLAFGFSVSVLYVLTLEVAFYLRTMMVTCP